VNPLIPALEAATALAACWLVARWRGRRLRRRLAELQARLDGQAATAAHAPADETLLDLPAPAVAPLQPTTHFRGAVALYALSALDACDLLLLTQYVQQRATPGSALHEAAGRVRKIGVRAHDNLGITAHDLARRAAP
jgi:hypothetical protein